MRRLIVGSALLAALALLTVPTTFGQMGGFGAPPFGGGRGGFGFGMPGGPGGFGTPGGPGGFGGPGLQLQGGGPGFLGNVTQVCTDSQGNRVLVANGGATSGYTNCEAAPPPPGTGFGAGLGGAMGFGGPGAGGAGFGGAPPALTRCTDSQGNTVLIRSGGSTAGYTNCTIQ